MATPVSPRWSPLPEGFGELLRTARLRAGLSLPRLAASVDASYGLLYDLEAERRPPSVTMAGRLSEALHLDPWEATVVQSTAVDDDALRSRRGTRHTRPRRSRNASPTQVAYTNGSLGVRSGCGKPCGPPEAPSPSHS